METQLSRSPRRRARRIALAAIVAGAVVTQPLLRAGAAAPPQPTYGTALVDGNPGEWSGGDAFGPLVSNDPPYDHLATASLRYDCDAGVLYVLVAADPGVVLQAIDPGEDYVRLATGKLVSGLSGNDGTAPDFAWIGRNGNEATGWEASAQVADGSYPAELRIHAKVPDDSSDGYQVIDLTPRYSDLTVACGDVLESSTTSSSSTTTTEATTTTTEDPGDPGAVQAEQVDSVPADPIAGTSTFTG